MSSSTPSRSSDHRLTEIVSRLIAPVIAAGAVEMHHYRTDVVVHAKADHSPVTAADREAEEILLAALAEIAPDIPVVAEELASAGQIPAVDHAFFLVDPLDGTREFINKRGEFTVNVALIEAGRPVLGIVFAPALGDLYATLGAHGAGHARIVEGARPSTLEACGFAPIATRQPRLDHLTALASRSHMSPESEAFLARYRISERRDSGSSLKFCTIARGDADIYPRLAPTMEWDIAAGHAILAAAGGAVTDPEGRPMRYGKAESGFLNGHFVAWGTPDPIPPDL